MSKSNLDLMAENYKWYYFFALPFLALALSEISNHFVDIPSYENLNIDSGRVAFSRTAGRWEHDLILIKDQKINKQEEIWLICNLNHTESRYCPPFDVSKERTFYDGKLVIARWYPQKYIYGVSNILLELEVNGKKLMDYRTQKEQYLNQVGDGSHVGLMMTIFLLGLGVYGHRVNHEIKKMLIIKEETTK